MSLKLSKQDLNKIIGKQKKGSNKESENDSLLSKKKKETEAERQLKQSISKLVNLQKSDKIFFNEDCSKCILHFKDVTLLSNNISLRLGARKMSKYKSLWTERITNLVNKEILKKWGSVENRLFYIEFCYEVKSNFMDYDGKIASFKAPLDGLIKSGLIKDDNENYLSMVLAKQLRTKDGNPNLIIMISAEKDKDRYFSEDFKKYLNI